MNYEVVSEAISSVRCSAPLLSLIHISIFYNKISEEEIQKYIDQLKTLGYAEEASASESVSTGVLLRKDETWISIASVSYTHLDVYKRQPVPIPNTEVKLTCAEDSSLETARENR